MKSSLGSCLHGQRVGHSFLWDVEILSVRCQSQYSWIWAPQWVCSQHGAFHSKGAGLVMSQLKGPLVGQRGVLCPHRWKVCVPSEGSGSFRDKAGPQKEVGVLNWRRRKSLFSCVVLAFQWLLVLKVFTHFKDTCHLMSLLNVERYQNVLVPQMEGKLWPCWHPAWAWKSSSPSCPSWTACLPVIKKIRIWKS